MASVGNIMANKGLTDLAAAIAPASAPKGNTGFGEYIQQTLDHQKPAETISGAAGTGSSVNEQSVPLRQDGRNSVGDPVNMQTGGTQEQGALTEDQLAAVNQKIRDAVKSALGIDEETMETVLAEMGIMPVELLQLENLQQFVLLVDGGQEITDFLMNEEMMGDFNLLSEVLQALDMTEITDTPMSEILQQMTTLTEEIPVEMASMSEGILVDSLSQDAELSLSQETADAQQEEPEVIVVQQENPGKSVNQTEPEGNQVTLDDQGQMVTSVNLSDSASQNSGSQNMEDTAGGQGSELPEQFVSARPEPEPEFIAVGNHIQQQMVADSVSEITAPQPTPQMVQIVEQIVEQIRIHAQADTTTMEMQLNPESLGKVLLTISSRAGMMTANFTVQTEEARMAVESQMYTLRENLEQKELKVDAVEVTVSNFEFTQSGGNGDDQKNLNQGDGRSRRFHMEEQEEDGEEISQEEEAERVRRNVMRDNGGSVDFIA